MRNDDPFFMRPDVPVSPEPFPTEARYGPGRTLAVLIPASAALAAIVPWAYRSGDATFSVEFACWFGLIIVVTFCVQRLMRNMLVDQLWVSIVAMLLVFSTGGARLLGLSDFDLLNHKLLLTMTAVGSLMQLLTISRHFKWIGAADLSGAGSI